ncbi:isoleucine--tRNA ligase [Patescibacteria group bacterium]|nr:isoleucine--tRNA ligase [Patescibacteria group bacterium]
MPKKITIIAPKTNVSFPKLEQDVLKLWKKEGTFEQSLKQTKKGKRFTFYDGPPFATGLPHYGNLMQGIIKDTIPRFRTMQGRYVERRFGWDCHGLPVEYGLEKELGIKNRQEILEMGVGKFNDACRAIVLRYAGEWRAITERIGRWVDMDNDYKTMDPDYMESVWWVIKQLWEKGLLYEGRQSMHICPRCATPLSNFEVLQGYADRDDPAVYVKLPLRHDQDVSLLIWTTTPWTLPGNVLAAVNKHLTYVEVEHDGQRLVLAESRLAAVFPNNDYTLRRTLRAEELIGQQYEPPFPKRNLTGTSYEVVAADAVNADEGTGILHVAPAFGEEDMEIGKREQAAFIQHIDITGTITNEVPRYRGLQALDANQQIIADLKKSKRLLRSETIRHSYPHCWRCETPLLNFATKSWFVAVANIKPELLRTNEQITWLPESVKDGRFGKWLEAARDWSISRNRFWGNPLPIWRCPDGHLTVIGSLDELEKLSGKRPKDLHKQYVDKITFDCPECNGKATRIEDVLDCWFESGSMPYAKEHYPFQHKKEFEESFPADFIAEALDQTRGWFYTLHVLGVALFDSPTFKNVVSTGIIVAEDGQKMSKSKQNYPDPDKVLDKYGADALRLYILSSPVVRGDDLRFREKGLEEIQRNFVSTLYNVYSFFTTYAAVDEWSPPTKPSRQTNVLDQWVTSRLNSLTKETTEALEQNDLMTASRGLMSFLDELSNWYVRRSRRRFWKSDSDTDKEQAYATLYTVLTTFTRLAAPITPFITDHLYRELTGKSVHLAEWPTATGSKVDSDLERQMSVARQVVRLGLAARTQAGIKVRQPVAEATVVDRIKSGIVKNKSIVQLVSDELNVKKLAFITKESGFVKEVIQPVPSEVGPLFGREAQQVIEEIKAGKVQRKGQKVFVRGRELPEDAVRVTWAPVGDLVVESSADVVVAINPDLNEDLVDEGRARELIRAFQELRKSSGLDVSDRITATAETDNPDLERMLDAHHDLIATEILAQSLEQASSAGDNTKSVQIDDKTVSISLSKIS